MTVKKQFDDRFRMAPRFAEIPAVRKKSEFVVKQQLDILSRISVRPSNMAFFIDLIEGRQKGDKPVIGYFCNMIPAEIIYALGAVPKRLGCGNAALVQPGEEVLSGEICPLAKASFASFLERDGTPNRCKAVIVPTSCDAKKKLGEILSDYVPVYMLNLPPEQDQDKYSEHAASEIAGMTAFLEKILDRKISASELKKRIDDSQRRTRLVREIQDARSANPGAMSARDFMLVIQSSYAATDLNLWCREADAVLKHIHSHKSERKRIRPRLVLTGAPIIWPNFKVLNLIEECGADIVADTLCTGAQSCYDPVVYGETGIKSLYRALASKYFFASPCPCFISQGKRISRVLELAAEFKADGVINYSLRLCQLFDMELYRLTGILKDKKMPFISLRTDYSLEDVEQLRVRLEAFLETLE